MFLRLLRCFTSAGSHPALLRDNRGLHDWVSPFGNLRITGCYAPPRSVSPLRRVLRRLLMSRHPPFALMPTIPMLTYTNAPHWTQIIPNLRSIRESIHNIRDNSSPVRSTGSTLLAVRNCPEKYERLRDIFFADPARGGRFLLFGTNLAKGKVRLRASPIYY